MKKMMIDSYELFLMLDMTAPPIVRNIIQAIRDTPMIKPGGQEYSKLDKIKIMF